MPDACPTFRAVYRRLCGNVKDRFSSTAARREAEALSERIDALITEMDGRWRMAASGDDRSDVIASELTGKLSR